MKLNYNVNAIKQCVHKSVYRENYRELRGDLKKPHGLRP